MLSYSQTGFFTYRSAGHTPAASDSKISPILNLSQAKVVTRGILSSSLYSICPWLLGQTMITNMWVVAAGNWGFHIGTGMVSADAVSGSDGIRELSSSASNPPTV